MIQYTIVKITVKQIFLFFVFLSILIVILNFRFLYMAGGDQSLYFDPAYFFKYVSTFWDENVSYVLGGTTMFNHILVPFALFFKIFSVLPSTLVEYCYFILVFIGIFFASFYYFYNYLFSK